MTIIYKFSCFVKIITVLFFEKYSFFCFCREGLSVFAQNGEVEGNREERRFSAPETCEFWLKLLLTYRIVKLFFGAFFRRKTPFRGEAAWRRPGARVWAKGRKRKRRMFGKRGRGFGGFGRRHRRRETGEPDERNSCFKIHEQLCPACRAAFVGAWKAQRAGGEREVAGEGGDCGATSGLIFLGGAAGRFGKRRAGASRSARPVFPFFAAPKRRPPGVAHASADSGRGFNQRTVAAYQAQTAAGHLRAETGRAVFSLPVSMPEGRVFLSGHAPREARRIRPRRRSGACRIRRPTGCGQGSRIWKKCRR